MAAWRGSLLCLTLAGVGATTGCGSSPSGVEPPADLQACPTTPFLTVPALDPALLSQISPLGAVEPPGHIFPSDHMYFYTGPSGTGAVQANVVAPADISVVEVKRVSKSGPTVVEDYAITFYACTDVQLWFGHVQTLSSAVSGPLGSFSDCDPPYSTGGATYTGCRKAVSIKLSAGTVMGTMGGPVGYGMDFGGYDRRVPAAQFVDPNRTYGYGQPFGQNQAICPVDYFVPAIASAYQALYSRFGVHRTIPPLCGSFMQDVPNSAQGRWFFDGSPNDDPHLGLNRDNIDPRVLVFSIGTSTPSLPIGYRFVSPTTTGRLNRDFSQVSADGQIYCYDAYTIVVPPPPARHILVQLTTATTLKIEGVLGSSCGDPSTWAFSGAATSFSR